MDILSIFILIGIGAVLVLGYKMYEGMKAPKDDQSFKMLQEQLFELQRGMKTQDKTINEQMNKSSQILSESLQKQFAASQKIIKDVTDNVKGVTEKLTKLDETNKQVVGFAEQMKSLENILKNPKQRGILGEFFLENLLSQQLPRIILKCSIHLKMVKLLMLLFLFATTLSQLMLNSALKTTMQ